MHAFFKDQDRKPYDYTKVVVKRSIPCVWIFMKRRRTKDYKVVFEKLNFEAEKNNLVLNPTSAIIDFELAAKRAYIDTWPYIKVKGN